MATKKENKIFNDFFTENKIENKVPIVISENVNKLITTLAKSKKVSKQSIVVNILEDWLNRHEEDCKKIIDEYVKNLYKDFKE